MLLKNRFFLKPNGINVGLDYMWSNGISLGLVYLVTSNMDDVVDE